MQHLVIILYPELNQLKSYLLLWQSKKIKAKYLKILKKNKINNVFKKINIATMTNLGKEMPNFEPSTSFSVCPNKVISIILLFLWAVSPSIESVAIQTTRWFSWVTAIPRGGKSVFFKTCTFLPVPVFLNSSILWSKALSQKSIWTKWVLNIYYHLGLLIKVFTVKA